MTIPPAVIGPGQDRAAGDAPVVFMARLASRNSAKTSASKQRLADSRESRVGEKQIFKHVVYTKKNGGRLIPARLTLALAACACALHGTPEAKLEFGSLLSCDSYTRPPRPYACSVRNCMESA